MNYESFERPTFPGRDPGEETGPTAYTGTGDHTAVSDIGDARARRDFVTPQSMGLPAVDRRPARPDADDRYTAEGHSGETAPVSGLAMQRAIDHLHAHPDRPITITELAGRAGVSARALQYAFRRAYDITPLQYLRRIRLQCAHHDLTAAGPGHDSVAVIAARWGFTNPGRFAMAYRHRYGISPGDTLRQ